VGYPSQRTKKNVPSMLGSVVDTSYSIKKLERSGFSFSWNEEERANQAVYAADPNFSTEDFESNSSLSGLDRCPLRLADRLSNIGTVSLYE